MKRPLGTSDLQKGLLSSHAVPLRPTPAGAIGNTLTFAWRAILKIKHTPEQLFDVVVTPIMFTVLFTYLFGGAIAGSTTEYLQFLLPGILVQTVVFTTLYTGFTLNTDISRGVYDRFRSMPIWKPSPLVGALVGDMARYTAAALVVVIVGLAMGFDAGGGWMGLIAAILILNVIAFGLSWIFTTVGLVVRMPSTVMTVSWLVLMPLTFASNAFVDPATMPEWLQSFVAVNPVTHAVTAVRGLMHGAWAPADLGLALLSPTITLALFAPVAIYLYNRK